MSRKPKPDQQDIDALAHSTGFDADTAKRLAHAGSFVTVPEGWAIVMESTPADSAYIVLEGEVEVRKGGETLATLGAGSVFGEIALVNHRLRNASVVSASPIRALRLDSEAIAELLEHDAAFGDTLRSMAQARLGE